MRRAPCARSGGFAIAALSPGWLDTGLSATHVLTCDLELSTMVFGSAVAGFAAMEARFDNVGLWFGTAPAAGASDLSCVGLTPGGRGTSYSNVEVLLIKSATADPFSGPVTYTTIASRAGSCTPAYFTPIELKKTIGPLRLGVTVKAGVLVYAWFADAATTVEFRIDGTLHRTFSFTDPPSRGIYAIQTGNPGSAVLPVNGQGTPVQIARVVQATGTPGNDDDSIADHVRFSNFEADVGDGVVSVTIPVSTAYKWSQRTSSEFLFGGGPVFGPPYRFTYDIDADETSGAAVAANATLEGARTCPTNFAVTKQFSSGGGFPDNYSTASEGHILTAAVLADPWLSAQAVVPYTEDRPFRFEGNDVKDPNDVTPTDYSVGSITIAAALSVLQSANAWATDLGSVVITGTPTVPIFTVSSEPVIVRRALAESWRDWNNPLSGDYQPTDLYRTTKRDFYASGALDDRWGWGLYALAEIDMTVPAGSDTLIALEVTWAIQRGAITIDTITVTYSAFTFPAGVRSTQRVDLMFPTALRSRPFYGERVDQIRIVGLLTGVTTLHAINLIADEDAYVTLMGRRAVLRDGTVTHSGIVIAQDGSAPSLLFGRDTAISPLSGDLDLDGWQDYRGDHQNGAFVVNQVTQEHPGKAVGMEQTTLQATLEELNRLEGCTATYSAAALDTAFTDPDGNVLGVDAAGAASPVVRAADWFVPTLPADRIIAGTPYDVRGQLVVTGCVVPAGVIPANMRIFQRNHLGMVLEALATDANYFRHPAGVTVRARAYTGGAPSEGDLLLGTIATDASGYARVPVRTGTIEGVDFNAYIAGA